MLPWNRFYHSYRPSIDVPEKKFLKEVEIPEELVLSIFKHLNLKELNRASAVCRRWKQISDHVFFDRKVSNQLIKEVLRVLISPDSVFDLLEVRIQKGRGISLKKCGEASSRWMKYIPSFNEYKVPPDFLIKLEWRKIETTRHICYFFPYFPNAFMTVPQKYEMYSVSKITILAKNENEVLKQDKMKEVEQYINNCIK